MIAEKTVSVDLYNSSNANNFAIFTKPFHPADGDMESPDNQKDLNLTGLNNCIQYSTSLH